MNEIEEYEHYRDESNREPQSAARKRKTSLTEIIPIRLSPRDVAAVKARAHAEGRSVSAWIRQAIAQALQSEEEAAPIEPEPDAMATVFVEPGVSFGAGQPVLLVEPVKVMVAQIISAAERVLDGYERNFGRVAHLMKSGHLEDVFSERIAVDEDLVHFRPRHQDTRFAQMVAHELQATQTAIARLTRLASEADTEGALARLRNLQDRVQHLHKLIRETEGAVLDEPKVGLSAEGSSGLMGFYAFVDGAHSVLGAIEDELVAAERVVTARER